MLTRKDMAAKLNIPVASFIRLVESRADFPKPAVRLSRETVRWEEADFERWLRTHRQSAKA
jgi:predicted DNA-binding transcriptional regulator AlpA